MTTIEYKGFTAVTSPNLAYWICNGPIFFKARTRKSFKIAVNHYVAYKRKCERATNMRRNAKRALKQVFGEFI